MAEPPIELRAALELAANGIPVFPVRPADKIPLVKWGLGEDGHPNIRRRRATTDPETIHRWWRCWPRAMIGMPTGQRSGIVVLDIDRKNGVDGLANLRAAGFEIPQSPVVVATPTGGLHVYFAARPGVRNSEGKIAKGVDVRGEGGFVVVPPSRRSDGKAYSYLEGAL